MINWVAIYMLPRLVIHNTYMRSFQYKILNMHWAIWYHLYNLKNVKNTYGGVLLLVKLL